VTTVQQISSRISPGLLSLLLGLCAGSAAAFGVATDLPLSLVGVAIAAAVVPAAAAVGIGVVWGLPIVAFGATTLLVINAAAILLAGTATLWYLGYRPEGWTAGAVRDNVSAGTTRIALATVVVLTAIIAVPGVAVVDHVQLENTANGAVQDTLERDQYSQLSLLSVRAEFTDLGLLSEPREITVEVSRPAGERYPVLARTIGERIGEKTDGEFVVTVEFVDRQDYDPQT
jgi:uncharacterized membrane protein